MKPLNLPRQSRAGARKSRATQALRSEQGAALIELALCLPVMLFIFAGIVDYALLLQEQMTISEAAAAGVAYGAIYGNQANLTGMQTAAANAAPHVTGFSSTASIIYVCPNADGTVSVSSTVSSTYNCSGYGTPIKYLKVVATGTSPSMVWGFTLGLGTNVALQSTSYYRVRWTP